MCSSDLDIYSTSDFNPYEITKNFNVKVTCNYNILDKLLKEKIDFIYDFIEILNHFANSILWSDLKGTL